ncbi:MAG: circadian clock protein KaiA [Synechococcaceae cyanobacterium ELA182]
MPEPALTIACLIRTPALADVCGQWLSGSRCQVERFDPAADPALVLDRRREDFDAVLLEKDTLDGATYQQLNELGLLLPAVVIGEVTGQMEYHDAEVHLPQDQLEQLSYSLDAALSRFVRRGLLSSGSLSPGNGEGRSDRWKLANRLKGRLSYLGVYYKRDPGRFLRNLPAADREELLRSLTRTYRDLLLSYFRDPAAANQALESFVNTAFFIDLPITQTVEIHMNLIEGFWKQLRLEGHKQDSLQDYRLALLDVMAHLCEMYRHSIPPDSPLTLTPSSTETFRSGPSSRSVTPLRSTELH